MFLQYRRDTNNMRYTNDVYYDFLNDNSIKSIEPDPFLVNKLISVAETYKLPTREYIIKGMMKYCYKSNKPEDKYYLMELNDLYTRFYRR